MRLIVVWNWSYCQIVSHAQRRFICGTHSADMRLNASSRQAGGMVKDNEPMDALIDAIVWMQRNGRSICKV